MKDLRHTAGSSRMPASGHIRDEKATAPLATGWTAWRGNSSTVPVLIQPLLRWADLRRQRLALADLDERLLQDIGVTEAARSAEVSRMRWPSMKIWRQVR